MKKSEFTKVYKSLHAARIAAARYRMNGAKRANVFKTIRRTKAGTVDARYKAPDCFAVYVMR